jgi:hypothetical protein
MKNKSGKIALALQDMKYQVELLKNYKKQLGVSREKHHYLIAP